MSMSDIRKKAQDKLRRKYGYSTNTNYGRGVILYRQDTKSYKLNPTDDYNIVHDLNVVMNNRPYSTDKQIEIHTTQYKDYGDDAPEDEWYEMLHDHTIYFSLEELELLYTVAREIAKENNWSSQIK